MKVIIPSNKKLINDIKILHTKYKESQMADKESQIFYDLKLFIFKSYSAHFQSIIPSYDDFIPLLKNYTHNNIIDRTLFNKISFNKLKHLKEHILTQLALAQYYSK